MCREWIVGRDKWAYEISSRLMYMHGALDKAKKGVKKGNGHALYTFGLRD